MRLRFLGTAAAEGWPGIFCACDICAKARLLGGKNLRSRSQVLIDDDMLVDFGPDTLMHALRDGLDLSKLTAMLITHAHQDHFLPSELAMHRPVFGYGAAHLSVYGNEDVASRLGELLVHPGLDMEVHTVRPLTRFTAGQTAVLPLRALHDRSQTCLMYVIERGGKRLFYAHDTGYYPEETWAAIDGMRMDAVICECTTGKDKDGKNHLGTADVFEVHGRLVKQGCVDERTRFIVTHFSHNGGMLHDELAQTFEPRGMTVAYDGMDISV